MAYATGTATDHADLLDRLRAFLTTVSGGPAWTELDYSTADQSVIFEAPGLSGTEEIHVGFQLYESVGTDIFGLYGWMFRAHDAGLAHSAQPGNSAIKFHPLWDSSIPYWFMANGQRAIIITKVSTVYTASYLGKFLQYGTAGEYGQPYYVGMPYGSVVRFSSINEGFRNFWDPGDGAQLLTPAGAWTTARNFYENASAEALDTTSIWVHPYAHGSSVAHTRYRELRDNVDGTYSLYPLILAGNDPSDDIYGEIDGANAIPGFSTASEDTVTVGADTYLVVQNTFRTSRQYYCAINQD